MQTHAHKNKQKDRYRGEDSFCHFRGEGGLWEWDCRRRLPTSPFFTFDFLGRSSSEEDEEPESVTKWKTVRLKHTLKARDQFSATTNEINLTTYLAKVLHRIFHNPFELLAGEVSPSFATEPPEGK